MHELLEKWNAALPLNWQRPYDLLDVTDELTDWLMAEYEERRPLFDQWADQRILWKGIPETHRVFFSPVGLHAVMRASEPLYTPRPSWDATGVALAEVFAARSADAKFKVGAVILANASRSVVGAGLNGRYPGSPTEERASLETGCSEFIHAEQQAVARARWEPGEKHTLYTTMEPCHECALLILAARHISRVVYVSEYAGDGRRRRGREILEEAGVEVTQWQKSTS